MKIFRSVQAPRRARIVLACGLCSLAALGASAPAQATTVVFPYTGGEGIFVVPAGITGLHVLAIGGSGGAAEAKSGGVAAQVTGDITVAPGQILYVEVGGKGQSSGEGGAGGFNGGGAGGGGGGGASDVRTAPRSAGLLPDTRLIVAGGGGGAGASGSGTGGVGGAAGEPGGASDEYAGGGAGTQTEGGAGASGCFGTGGNGERGVGGAGGYEAVETGPGGGGGGGLFGGGGGAGACHVGSSGGGGGSSFVPPWGSAILASASAAPVVEISYTASAPVVTPPPTNPVPNTTISSHPKPKIVTAKKRVKVKFGFSSNVAGASFECKLDKGSFAPCASPKTYKVKLGKHKFSVEAIGAGGTDPTPASFSFKVVKKAQ